MTKTDLRELDIFSLKAIDANKHYLAPEYSGIYIAFNDVREVVYIGKSRKIRNRIYNHDKLSEINQNNDIKIVFFKVNELENIEAEYAMIEIHNPVLNSAKLPAKWKEKGDDRFFHEIDVSSDWKVNEKLVRKYEDEKIFSNDKNNHPVLRAVDILPLIKKMPNNEVRKLARHLIDLI